MNDKILLERITLNPNVMVGKPVIRGTRLTVEFILNLLAHGATTAEILDEYDGLTPKDILACLLFAKESISKTEFMPLILETATLDEMWNNENDDVYAELLDEFQPTSGFPRSGN